MRLAKLPPEPSALLDFFRDGLESLGAICEQTWHNRLEVVAEGAAAKLWNGDGALTEVELTFPGGDDTGSRQAEREVFPGCPLTFRLAETLRPPVLSAERVCLPAGDASKPPANELLEKLWHAQVPGLGRWQQESACQPTWHFSVLFLVRSEIQAIDQHWFLHQTALSLPDGTRDAALEAHLGFLEPAAAVPDDVKWPTANPSAWRLMLARALREDLADELAAVRRRQEMYLQRELARIDAYFASYEHELAARRHRASGTSVKTEDRLAAARREHEHRREDQVRRHEIRVIPHVDALLLLAEPAWEVPVAVSGRGLNRRLTALFVPRSRRWVLP
ncbi:MAG: hypothetical protein ACYDH9_17060 [Limisphaerales bacterium]